MAEAKDVNRQIAYDVIKQLYLDDIISVGDYINLSTDIMNVNPRIAMSKITRLLANLFKSETKEIG